MIYIEGNSIDELFIKIAKKMILEGNMTNPRGLKTIELQNVWLTLLNPSNSVLTLKSRNLSQEYLKAEMDWYISGDLNIENISKYSSFWTSLRNLNNTVNSNYGFLSLKQTFNGLSQFEWCYEKLSKDKNSRQALINYNQPCHKYEGNKDFVCTISQSFRINNDKLDTTIIMRSNDLIYGLSYDLPWFYYLQKELAKKLLVDVGVLNHIALSLHVYEKHFEMLNNISKEVLND